ncbi:hypothetical protein FRC02_009746 [Tulasnella sp. 418]|nr:hypothetical protein FRC02_009746 [Tulasnella sp. 418]
MSNRIVPSTYRSVIDDVMANIRQDFADFGVDEDVLAELQHKWEQKVVESNVAEFEPAPPQPPPAPAQQPLHPVPPSGHVQLNLPVTQRIQSSYPAPSPGPHYPQVKTEPHEPSYVLPPLPGPGPPPGMHHLLLPGGQRPLPGQQLTAQQVQQVMQQHQHFQQLVQQQQAQQKPQIAQSPAPPARVPQVDGPSYIPASTSTSVTTVQTMIPQLDGPSSVSSSGSSRSSASPPPISRPGPSTVPQPSSNAGAAAAETEEIGSDLDDDDSEGDADENGGPGAGGDGSGPGDIVYCTYDKVQRVKNKWKCVLKDGIISVGGKDYLFSKCAGEFEW